MTNERMNKAWTTSLLQFISSEVGFATAFAVILLNTTGNATTKRLAGWAALLATTYTMERMIALVCLEAGRPHWAATAASLLWVQFISASELLLVSRVDVSQLPFRRGAVGTGISAIDLMWNMRRVGTRWQVKNVSVPLKSGGRGQSRIAFVFNRLIVTMAAYLFVDLVVSMPPPEPELLQPAKATLFHLDTLSAGDIAFRAVMTISYWLITGILNLFMTNVGAIISVFLHLNDPADCPPLYRSFTEAFTVRRFWGISWHQMFRAFLTGHADLVVDNTLPFLPRRSFASRYTRLAIAFFISGAIHYRADQLMGVPNAENGAIVFFLLHAGVIVLEDTVAPLISKVVPSASLRRVLGGLWVLVFFIWSSPIWTYSGSRLGIESTALLPVRVIGPWVSA